MGCPPSRSRPTVHAGGGAGGGERDVDLRLICADGRFVTVPGGVFYVDGPMTEPVDAVALTGALQAGRVPGATAIE